jgi:LmbE family N-acetylglucosaminyl deacetylase
VLLEDVRTVLVVVAHCDDAEWMFGGTVARLVRQGASVDYVVTTDGASGGIDMEVSDAELAATRASEQRNAAEVLGVRGVTFLGFHNDELAVTLQLKRAIVREIRRTRPDLVLTLTPHRALDAPIGWNHADHIATGEATLQAVYPEALMPRIHPELLDEGLAPHEVTEVWFPALADADRYVDVSAVVETKMDAVWCHWSQNGEAGGDRAWMFDHHIAPPMLEAGDRIGVRHAERFRRVRIAG